ncbi:hypothetical protein KVV02_007408, partial [Mortierella alpina]
MSPSTATTLRKNRFATRPPSVKSNCTRRLRKSSFFQSVVQQRPPPIRRCQNQMLSRCCPDAVQICTITHQPAAFPTPQPFPSRNWSLSTCPRLERKKDMPDCGACAKNSNSAEDTFS